MRLKLTDEMIIELREDPRPVAVIAKERGLSVSTIYRGKDPMEFLRAKHKLAARGSS